MLQPGPHKGPSDSRRLAQPVRIMRGAWKVAGKDQKEEQKCLAMFSAYARVKNQKQAMKPKPAMGEGFM